jgi:hypothetical protein
MKGLARSGSFVLAAFVTTACIIGQCAASSNFSQQKQQPQPQQQQQPQQQRPLASRIALDSSFRPPPVFRNVNLLRTTNLEKGYVRETVIVVIENTSSRPQDEYFLAFPSRVIDRVGGLQVRDKKQPEKGGFDLSLVDFDSLRWVQDLLYLCLFFPPLVSLQLQKKTSFEM